MNKQISFLFAVLAFGLNLFGQNASSYFPSNISTTWEYEEIPLDSVNNEMNSLAYFKIDSLAAVKDYNGKTANVVVSKVGHAMGLPFSPSMDTTFISFDGNTAYSFTRFINIDSLTNILLSSPDSKNILMKASSGTTKGRWFSYYHFTQPQYQSYKILTMDTTVDIKGSAISIRYEIKGTRLGDEYISTKAGEFYCKKFNVQNIVSFLITSNIAIPIITGNDSVWISQNKWIVQEIVPTTKIDLSLLGFTTQYLPGAKQVLIPKNTTGAHETLRKVNKFKLYQNYPNPFNPTTTIKYQLPVESNVDIILYNIIGSKIKELLNEKKDAGSYEVTLNAGNLASGLYFYRVIAQDESGKTFVSTKKMMLIK